MTGTSDAPGPSAYAPNRVKCIHRCRRARADRSDAVSSDMTGRLRHRIAQRSACPPPLEPRLAGDGDRLDEEAGCRANVGEPPVAVLRRVGGELERPTFGEELLGLGGDIVGPVAEVMRAW